MSTSQQTAAAAEIHQAEGRFMLEEQTFNTGKSLRYEYVLQFPNNKFFIY
jgi:hypothetical protein